MLKKTLLVVVCLLVNACASIEPKEAYQQYQPSTLPVRNITHFNTALQCFDDLLLKAKVKPIYISSEGIPNHAGSEITLLSGRDMLITTINQLHRSNVFRFIDLPSMPSSQLLEQLGITKSHPALFEENVKIYSRWNKNNEPANYPDYMLIGAITQADKGIMTDGTAASIALENGDFGISRDDMVSVIAMDMNIVNTANFAVLNGVGSSNSIAVYKQGLAGDLGGRIKKAGVYFNFSFDKSEGTGQAIRTLMQLNTIEVLGKLAKVPYQQCLPTSIEAAEKPVTARYTPAKPPLAKNDTAVDFKITPFKTQYKLNEVLRFQAQVAEDAYMHCFYQNYRGQIWRIFPNQVQATNFLIANKPVSIPEQNKAFEIALDMANVTEQVMCLAAREKLTSDFASMAVSTQSTLPVSSLTQVLDNYQQKTLGAVSQHLLSIQVK